MTAGIYKIENVINGHCYIGQSVDLKKRKRTHFSRLENNKHCNPYFLNAYKKYGKENFMFSVILYCEPLDLTYYEQKLVDVIEPEYSIRRNCVDSNKGVKLSKEHKQKISLGNKGKKLSEETKKKISLIAKTKLHQPLKTETKNKIGLASKASWKNRSHKVSDETKRKLSLAAKGKIISEETRKKLRLANTGKKRSEESKLKMSLSAKARCERKRQQVKL